MMNLRYRLLPLLCFTLLIMVPGLSAIAVSQGSDGTPRLSAADRLQQLVQNYQNQNFNNALATLELTRFMRKFPKGADLHSHLTGAIDAEELLQYAQDENYCIIDQKEPMVSVNTGACKGKEVSARYIGRTSQSDLYSRILNHWSMRKFLIQDGLIPDLSGPITSRSSHFFNTFDLSDQATKGRLRDSNDRIQARMVASVRAKAERQNIHYLELMRTFRRRELRDYVDKHFEWIDRVNLDTNMNELYNALTTRKAPFKDSPLYRNSPLTTIVQNAMDDITRWHLLIDDMEGCYRATPGPVCAVEVKYIVQIIRFQRNHERMFAEMMIAFAVAAADDRVVGVNMVGKEHTDFFYCRYEDFMKMLAFLKSKYTSVNVTLHAGELSSTVLKDTVAERVKQVSCAGRDNYDIPPNIKLAIDIGGAQRIGHGVTINSEPNNLRTLTEMVAKNIAVEINLTSNQYVLDVEGRIDHPLLTYLGKKVPVVLSTDDEGVFITDLSREYMRAAVEHGLDYDTLKNISRNSLHYSFLPGASLWTNHTYNRRSDLADACQKSRLGNTVPSRRRCENFLSASPKAKLQWDLERRFAEFERAVP